MKNIDKVLQLKIAELVKIKNILDGISIKEAEIVKQRIMNRYGLNYKEAEIFMNFARFSTISDGTLNTEEFLEWLI